MAAEPDAIGSEALRRAIDGVAGALSVAEYLENDEADTVLAALPFSFVMVALAVGFAVSLVREISGGQVAPAPGEDIQGKERAAAE